MWFKHTIVYIKFGKHTKAEGIYTFMLSDLKCWETGSNTEGKLRISVIMQ